MILYDILDSMARTIFVTAWADLMEERAAAGIGEGDPNLSGAQLEDVAPPTPSRARDAALVLYGRIEEKMRHDMANIWHNAQQGEGHRREPTQEDFGHYLAMMACGSGVSWYDNHPKFFLSDGLGWKQTFDTPNVEHCGYYAWDAAEDLDIEYPEEER